MDRGQFRQSDLSDEELVARFRQSSDMEVLSTLFGRYLELVYGVCMKYLKDPVDAEDAVMDIYEQLPSKIHRHKIETFRSWLYVLVKNHCLQIFRNRKREAEKTDDYVVHSGTLNHPVDEERHQQLQLRLRNCLENLQEMQRKCVERFYYEGRSYLEIAGELNIAKDRVRSHIQNGRRNLKNCMNSGDETAG